MRGWLLFTALAFAAACLTPQGPAGLLFPLRHLAMHNLARINEWEPANFGHLQPLEIVILAALYVGLTGQVKLPRFRVVLILGLLHAALYQAANGELLGIIGPLLIADAVGSLPPRRDASRRHRFGRGDSPWHHRLCPYGRPACHCLGRPGDAPPGSRGPPGLRSGRGRY